MKCDNCNSCLGIYNLEIEGLNRLYWYCSLCNKVYKLNYGKKYEIIVEPERKEITDKILIKIKEMKYG
jgi:DNA-directed RNA polymerase subunit M/transcription elongation factor TFIIS